MQAFDYGRMVLLAQRLLRRFGQNGQLILLTPGSGPKHDPGPPTEVAHPVFFAVLEYDRGEVDGTRILSTHQKVLMEPGSVVPVPGSRLVEKDGSVLVVIDADPLAPAGTVVLWEIQASRA